MADPRVTKLAKILVDHCTQPGDGDTVMIRSYSELAKPLVVEVYRRLLQSGAGEIINRVDFEEIREVLLGEA
ncbi:MAG TPA: aminopeptidase, partial [Anaerolineae bacterium]|nr:aminopeptidase [Anaerolineae bacterium]